MIALVSSFFSSLFVLRFSLIVFSFGPTAFQNPALICNYIKIANKKKANYAKNFRIENFIQKKQKLFS